MRNCISRAERDPSRTISVISSDIFRSPIHSERRRHTRSTRPAGISHSQQLPDMSVKLIPPFFKQTLQATVPPLLPHARNDYCKRGLMRYYGTVQPQNTLSI